MHDKRVMDRSGLAESIESGKKNEINFKYFLSNVTFYFLISGRKPIPRDHHLLGDLGYPLKVWCMTAYKRTRPLTEDEKKFNLLLSKCRSSVERAFRLLKCRFRRLKLVENSDVAFIAQMIITCCILHNVCIGDVNGLDFSPEEEEDDNVEFDDDVGEDTEAISKRDSICRGIRDGIY